MRLLKHAIAFIAVVASASILAAAPQDRDVITTGDLIELCSVGIDDPLYDAAMGFCLGYVDAALDYHAALTAGPSNDPITCPDTAVSREEVVVVVLEWSSRNPQHHDTETPVHGVMRAVSEKWPCAEQ